MNVRPHLSAVAFLAFFTSHSAAETCGDVCTVGFWTNATPEEVSDAIDRVGVNARDDLGGDTLLHFAVIAGDIDDVTALVRAGADIGARNALGETPIYETSIAEYYARLYGIANVKESREKISLLLNSGADLNARDLKGSTPLHHAAVCGDARSVMALISGGADVNAKNESGQTPLHYAASSESSEAVAVLLDAGAIVNAVNKKLRTPLHSAAANGVSRSIILLLNAGADAGAKDWFDSTPWDSAERNENLKGTDGYWALSDARFK
jgi:ankyrin repeat protein